MVALYFQIMKNQLINKWSFLSNIRLYFLVILAFLAAIFLYLKFLPFGQATYSRDYFSSWRSGKGFIYGFTPAERLSSSTDAAVIIGDPVYFSVFTPRSFERAELTVVYRDRLNLDTPIVEVGVLADGIVWRYDLKPLDNKSLDYLLLRWNVIREGKTVLLQKEKRYSGLKAWREDLSAGRLLGCQHPSADCLATYNSSLPYEYRATNYQSPLPTVINTPLRGGHELYFYLQNEPLAIKVDFVDQNLDQKAAPISLILYSGDRIVSRRDLGDLNHNPGNGQAEERTVSLEEKGLPAGIYKLEIKVTDDTIIKRIASSIGRLSFVHKIWPVSGSGLNLYTDSPYLQVKALSPASLQTIKFAGEDFVLAEPYKQLLFKSSQASGRNLITLEKDNIILENSGVFAFSSENIFNPSWPKVDRFFSVKNQYQYIIADYEPPFEDEGWKTAKAEFDITQAYRQDGKYSFMISVPGLSADDGSGDNLEIAKIKIKFKGRNLWQMIWD